jgi:histidinol-phosphate aminotransferase
MDSVAPPGSLPVPDYIRAIAPYVGGKPISDVAREYGLDPDRIVKLASNENPLGMPESAQAAIARVLGEGARYPDGNAFDLKAALALRYGVSNDWITLGNGSNDILMLVAQAFLQPGSSAVYSQYAFIVYPLAAQILGARGIAVRATADLGHDLAGMRSAVGPDTQVVFLANPNNPTGTFLPAAEIEAFIASLPAQVIVVLDEAYNEYLHPTLRVDSTDWVRRFPNLVVSRTFSKAYGLAGLRVGYAIAQPFVTDVLNRIRQPFNVNSLAQAAAVAALSDEAFLERTYAMNRAGYRQLTAAFEALGLTYIASHGNFVLVKVGNTDDAGARVNLGLLKQGVIVRPVGNYGLPQWIRVSIGLAHENEALIAALPAALAA